MDQKYYQKAKEILQDPAIKEEWLRTHPTNLYEVTDTSPKPTNTNQS